MDEFDELVLILLLSGRSRPERFGDLPGSRLNDSFKDLIIGRLYGIGPRDTGEAAALFQRLSDRCDQISSDFRDQMRHGRTNLSTYEALDLLRRSSAERRRHRFVSRSPDLASRSDLPLNMFVHSSEESQSSDIDSRMHVLSDPLKFATDPIVGALAFEEIASRYERDTGV